MKYPLGRIKLLIWLVLFVLYIFMAAFVMGGASKAINQTAAKPECAVPLDLYKSGASKEQIFTSFDCMGSAARTVYRGIETLQDVIYPLVYSLLFAFTIYCLTGYLSQNKLLISLLTATALPLVIFDYFENFNAVKLVDQFPDLNQETVDSFSTFNQLKWGLAFVCLGIIVLLAVASLWKLVRGKGKPEESV